MANDTKILNYKIAFYIRVSTEEQAESPEGSLKSQKHRLQEAVDYKNRNGNFGEVKGVYVDPGISAKDMKRPKLQELLAAVRNREINLIMVTELSRLSRNTRDFIEMWDMMRAYGCRFLSLREDFDTTTAAGELVLFQLMNLAQFERRQTSERVEANIRARASRGLYNGGVVPLGLRTVENKPGYLEADPPMAEVVREAFNALIREGSLSLAAKWLNDQGYTFKRQLKGGGSHSRNDHFTVDNLHCMLRNKAYIGLKVYNHRGQTHEAKAVWDGIVDPVIFERVGKTLDENRHRVKHRHSRGRLGYLLSGVVRCKSCGSFMPGKSATGNGGKFGYYEHSWATKRDSTLSKKIFACDPHRVPAKVLEQAVWNAVVDFLTQEENLAEMLNRVRKQGKANPTTRERDRLRAKISGINSQLEGVAERIAELPKGISAAPLYKQMQKLEGVRNEYEASLALLGDSSQGRVDRIVHFNTLQAFSKHYREFLTQESNVQQRRKLVRKFVEKVEVGVDSIRINFLVDREHYERELALAEASSASGKPIKGNSRFLGSQTLTFGPQDWT